MYPQVRSSTPLADRNDNSLIEDDVSAQATIVEVIVLLLLMAF